MYGGTNYLSKSRDLKQQQKERGDRKFYSPEVGPDRGKKSLSAGDAALVSRKEARQGGARVADRKVNGPFFNSETPYTGMARKRNACKKMFSIAIRRVRGNQGGEEAGLLRRARKRYFRVGMGWKETRLTKLWPGGDYVKTPGSIHQRRSHVEKE